MKFRNLLEALFVSAILSAVAVAQTPQTLVAFQIPSQTLGHALADFGEQTGLQVLVRAEDVASGQASPAVSGELSVCVALERVLANSGLTYDFLNDRTIRVRAIQAKPIALKADQACASDSRARSFKVAQGAPRVEAAGASSASASENSENGNTLVQEVVVTAQKRIERLRDVPISVSVLGGAALDTSTFEGVTESLTSVPGVLAQQSYVGGGTQVGVRGVTASSTLLEGASPIAYYVDSVPFGLVKTSVAPDSNAFDLERVEVLRGPQGTLYGANALNGVVRVLTKDANLNEFEFKGRTSGSSTKNGGGNYRGDMAVNVPFIEGKLAARAVVGYENQSGWIDRPNEKEANDSELRNYRLKLNAAPTDQLSLGLSAWSSRADYGAPSMAADNGRYGITANEPIVTDYNVYGFKAGYEVSGYSVASTTSYIDYKNESSLDMAPFADFLAGTPYINKLHSNVFSQEFSVNSPRGAAWRWSAGAMYRDARDRLFQRIDGVLPAVVDFKDTSESYAAFGEVTRVLAGGKFELTGGLRYFEDREGTAENSSFSGVPGTPLLKQARTFHKVTPRVVATWHLTPQSMVYASYGEGFRSGFYQTPAVSFQAPDLPPVNPDKLKNYELGTKSTFLAGQLNLDMAVYFIDWNGVQSDNAIKFNQASLIALINGESASGAGVDFGITARPLTGLELGLSASWNDLTWDSDVVGTSGLLFSKGDRLSLSPEYTAGASAEYAFPLGGGGYMGRIGASGNYTSATYTRIATGSGQGDAILTANARLTLEGPSHWTATLYGDNLGNEQGVVLAAPFPIPDWRVRPRPRTIGLQLQFTLR